MVLAASLVLAFSLALSATSTLGTGFSTTAQLIPSVQHASFHTRDKTVPKPPLLAAATNSDIDKARSIVKDAQAKSAGVNAARLANPIRNRYILKPGGSRARGKLDTAAGPDLPPITHEVEIAAALVSEADAYTAHVDLLANNHTQPAKREAAAAATYWMGEINHSKGHWPWGNNANFTVFRDVTKYGAVGDGITDDTSAIRKAITDGQMCGPGCYGSTTLNAIIYFPPGKSGVYRVSRTLETYFGTQFIGDAINPPTIKAASSFAGPGIGVISTDRYVGGGDGTDGLAKEWFINTANFYRQIRNLKIDITEAPSTVVGLHYQVAQATSLQNVEIFASTAKGTSQQGIFAENGSGGFMSDVTIHGGNVSIYTGNQQFTSHRITLSNSNIGVQMIWDWGWTWKEIYITNCTVGFRLTGDSGNHQTGSVLITDSVFNSVTTAVLSFPANQTAGSGTTGITLDNVALSGVKNAVMDTSNKVYLGGVTSVDTWVLGNTYTTPTSRSTNIINQFSTPRDRSLVDSGNPLAKSLPTAPYFTRAKPQYEKRQAKDFVHMKTACFGDGVTDDTNCFQRTINNAQSLELPIFVNAGTYIITNTIYIPSGSVIVGEAWAQIVATGSNFGDGKNPRPLFQIGKPGEKGSVEMQDLIFTSKGPTPGLTVVEWNLRATGQGMAAMWDCHVRLGGAVGTNLTSSTCPPSRSGTDSSSCNAGSLMMHITPQASAYLENVWLWVADHDIDDPDWNNDNNVMTQCSIYVARGMLVESIAPTWLYGTASEHATFYQYTFYNAKNIIAGEIQTESPYYQPNPVAPGPFDDPAISKLYVSDFDYSICKDNKDAPGCDSSWAVRFVQSSNIAVHGAGLYSWFKNYDESCVDTQTCQKALVQMENNHGGLRIHNLVTIGASTMIQSDGDVIKAQTNMAVSTHPFWSQIAAFDPATNSSSGICTRQPTTTRPTPRDGTWDTFTSEQSGSLLTLVNGTPRDFVPESDQQTHMLGWNFSATVPAGSSVQYYIEFLGDLDNPHDASGTATFRLAGTDKKFTVHCFLTPNDNNDYHVTISYDNLGTHDMIDGGTLDLGLSKYDGHSLNWVLTGSETYGYWTSARPPVAWQQSIIDIIGERKLRYITMPGTHDSGMSTIVGKTTGASNDNSQTQYLDFYHQLVRGARWFDTRPVIAGGIFRTGHYSDVSGITQGGNGQSITDIIDQVNKFMDDYPGELVILSLQSDNDYDTDAGCCQYPRFTDAQWVDVLTQFANGINRPCAGFDDRDLSDATMNEFIGDGKGCVAMIIPGSRGTVYRNPARGVYYYRQLPNYNQESKLGRFDTEGSGVIERDQITRVQIERSLTGPGQPDNKDLFHVMQWIIPNSHDVTNPLYNLATLALGNLFWYGYSHFTPTSYPNVLFVDYFSFTLPPTSYLDTQDTYFAKSDGTITALAMAVNLAIASQNCIVGGGTIF